MQTSSPQSKSATRAHDRSAAMSDPDELRFIADLGRSLHFSVHPNKVAQKVVDQLCDFLESRSVSIAVELDNLGFICRTANAQPADDDCIIDRKRLESWMEFMPPQIGYTQNDRSDFLLDGDHVAEYICPVRVGGRTVGAVVAAYSEVSNIDDRSVRVIDAVTQMAAMSLNLAKHYGTAIDDSVTTAREEHRKFNEAVLDALPVSLYVVDRDYKIVTWNRHREAGEQGIPRDLAVGRDLFDVLERYPKGRIRDEFERAFRTGEIERIEQKTQAEDGTTTHWMVSKIPMRDAETGEVSHVITVGEDITQRVEAINAVTRAEKLAAVGRLAAGVVHEINNPLATIAACAEALEHRIAEGAFAGSDSVADLEEYLGIIKSEAFRCKTITTGLLDFSRVRATDRTPVEISEIVRSAANLISHQKQSRQITIEVELADSIPPVLADGGQIQQAIIALATNSIDAMPMGGTLTFRAFAKAGKVVIEVADTGLGISPENITKIFEPFFTTKDIGKGTGLGLAVCYGIVSEHNGRLNVRSTQGKGTVFSISLPALREK